MALSLFLSLLLLLGIGGIFFLWFAYDRRGTREHHRRYQTVFHCVRCGHLYGSTGRPRQADCPACGLANIPLRF